MRMFFSPRRPEKDGLVALTRASIHLPGGEKEGEFLKSSRSRFFCCLFFLCRLLPGVRADSAAYLAQSGGAYLFLDLDRD